MDQGIKVKGFNRQTITTQGKAEVMQIVEADSEEEEEECITSTITQSQPVKYVANMAILQQNASTDPMTATMEHHQT